MKQTRLEAERIISKWERRTPDEPTVEPKCFCGCLAKYKVMGRYYCSDCADDSFYDIDGGVCDFCNKVMETTYVVGKDVMCEKCFNEEFRI